jgi:hypothetical protein
LGKIDPDSYAFIDEHYRLDKRVFDKEKDDSCFYFIIKTDCNDNSNWEKVISNRNNIGASIYLNQGDYILFQRNSRSLFPWVKQ